MNYKRKKLFNICLGFVLAIAMLVTNSFATSIGDLNKQKQGAQDDIANFRAQVSDYINKINEVELQAQKKSDEIAIKQEELDKAVAIEERQYNSMKTRIRYMYEEGNQSLVNTLFSAKSLSDFISKAEYIANISDYDRNMLVEFAQSRLAVQNMRDSLKAELDELQALHNSFLTKQSELEYLISQKESEIDSINAQIQDLIRQSQVPKAKPASPAPVYNPVTGNAVVDRAYQWVGAAEYEWGACRAGYFDCSGFVSYCLTGGYYRLGTTYTFLTWPQVSEPLPGDICVNTGHCGIYIGGGSMIHAATYGVGVVVGPVQSDMIYVRY